VWLNIGRLADRVAFGYRREILPARYQEALFNGATGFANFTPPI